MLLWILITITCEKRLFYNDGGHNNIRIKSKREHPVQDRNSKVYKSMMNALMEHVLFKNKLNDITNKEKKYQDLNMKKIYRSSFYIGLRPLNSLY